MNLTYRLEVLTPIHIGSGQKILPSEYILDMRNRKLIRVNMDSFFTSSDFDFEGYLKRISRGQFYLGDYYLEQGVKNPKYELDARSSAGELSAFTNSPSGSVNEFIKEAGRPYLPGSSLKGSIRSMVIRHLLRSDLGKRGRYESSLDGQLQEFENRRRRIRAEFFSTPAEHGMTGSPNKSIFRTILIGDSQPISQSEMNLEYVKVITLNTEGRYNWKRLGERRNVESFTEATPIFFESVKPGTVIMGSLKFDTSMFKEEVARLLGYDPVSIDAVKNMSQVCRAEAEEIIKGEMVFYQNCGFDLGVSNYKGLSGLLPELGDDEFLMPVAWGTGYRNKTVSEPLEKNLFRRIRSSFRLGRKNLVFPKTRKIVFENGEPAATIGWVRMKLEGF